MAAHRRRPISERLNARTSALAVLDVLTNYELDGKRASYSTLRDRVTRLCERLIDEKFAEWYKPKYQAARRPRNTTDEKRVYLPTD